MQIWKTKLNKKTSVKIFDLAYENLHSFYTTSSILIIIIRIIYNNINIIYKNNKQQQ